MGTSATMLCLPGASDARSNGRETDGSQPREAPWLWSGPHRTWVGRTDRQPDCVRTSEGPPSKEEHANLALSRKPFNAKQQDRTVPAGLAAGARAGPEFQSEVAAE